MNRKILILFGLILSSCELGRVEDTNFIGLWKVEGRPLYSGIVIQIKQENNGLKGYIIKPPVNKHAKLFIDSGAIFIDKISRTSNYSFKIIENKIGKELLDSYGTESSIEFHATLSEDHNRIYLTKDFPHTPKKSEIFYERILKP